MSENELPPRRKGDDWNPDDFQVPAGPAPRAWEPIPMEPPREPEEPLDVQINEPEDKKPAVKRGILALLAVAILTVPIVFYMAAVPPTPAAADANLVEEQADSAPPPPARSRSVPAVSGGRSGGGGGGRSSGDDYYQQAGNISDIFCRPRGEETADAWRRRVPLYCVDRFRAPGR